MAQLNDTMVQGDLRVTGSIFNKLYDFNTGERGATGRIPLYIDDHNKLVSSMDTTRYLRLVYDYISGDTTLINSGRMILALDTSSPSDGDILVYKSGDSPGHGSMEAKSMVSAGLEPLLTSARGVSKYSSAIDGSIIGIHDDNERGGTGIYGIAFNANGCVRWNGTSYVIQKITPAESNGNQAHQFNGISNYAYNALSATYATTAGTATTATTALSLACSASNEFNLKKDPNQSASYPSIYINYKDADGTASSSVVQLVDYYFCDRKQAWNGTKLHAGHFITTNADTASYGMEIHRNDGSKDTGLLVERTDKTYNNKTFALIYGIGTGGDNYGIWSDPLGAWAVKGVASEGKVYLHAGGIGDSAKFISFVVGSIGTAANTIYFP